MYVCERVYVHIHIRRVGRWVEDIPRYSAVLVILNREFWTYVSICECIVSSFLTAMGKKRTVFKQAL